MSPELLMLRPAGSFPLTVHVADDPEASSWKEYSLPTIALFSTVLVIVGDAVVVDGVVGLVGSVFPDEESEAGWTVTDDKAVPYGWNLRDTKGSYFFGKRMMYWPEDVSLMSESLYDVVISDEPSVTVTVELSLSSISRLYARLKAVKLNVRFSPEVLTVKSQVSSSSLVLLLRSRVLIRLP